MTVAGPIACSPEKFWRYPTSGKQAAPENVSTRGLPERCPIVRIKQRCYRSWRHQETLAGAACQHTLSPGKPNVPITRVRLRTVKSGSPPGAGLGHPQFVISHLSPAERSACTVGPGLKPGFSPGLAKPEPLTGVAVFVPASHKQGVLERLAMHSYRIYVAQRLA